MSDPLTGADLALLNLLNESEGDYDRAYQLSRALGHDHEALYRVFLKLANPTDLAKGHFPLMLSPADDEEVLIDDGNGNGWRRMDSMKILAILKRRGLPEEWQEVYLRDYELGIKAGREESAATH